MSRDLLVQMTKRTLAHAKASSAPLADGVVENPSISYYDPDLWAAEIDQIFKRVPLVLGFSAELPAPSSYRALTVLGTPVLLSRGEDGVVRAFVNMCSHRGAIVVEEGNGSARRFTCPYHAWNYDSQGTLVGIRKRELFGELDTSCLGLTELPCEERAGFVFGSVTPGLELHLDEYLCGYDELLEHHKLANCHFVGRQEIDGPNWKIAFDGYIDQYHLPVLHGETFGDEYCDRVAYDTWGPHIRMSPPDHRFLGLDGVPETEWDIPTMLGGVWTIFPNVSLASFNLDNDAGRLYMVSQLIPGDTVGTSRTYQNFFTVQPPTEAHREPVADKLDFLMHVVRDQDYFTGLRIQQAVQTGAKTSFLYGRNELGGQHFHRWVGDLVRADNQNSYLKLLAAAEPTSQP